MNALLAHCSAAFATHGSLFAVFFMAGLTGGFTHCLAMCGSIAASGATSCNTGCSKSNCGKRSQLANATQFTFHLGRATSYGALGFLTALFSRQIQASPYWPWLSAAMLAMAGATFIVSSLPHCKHPLATPSTTLTYARGALLGFMPCGLLYAAFMMAAPTANPLSGMFAMWIFVLGTIPALLIASIGAAVIAQKWQRFMQRAGRAMMLFNGLSLLVMAERIIRT